MNDCGISFQKGIGILSWTIIKSALRKGYAYFHGGLTYQFIQKNGRTFMDDYRIRLQKRIGILSWTIIEQVYRKE